MAEKMAAYFGQPVSDFRYAKFELYDGRQWTIHCCWQRRVEELGSTSTGCRSCTANSFGLMSSSLQE